MNYAGIGSRATPLAVCATMQTFAAILGAKGIVLRSGRAQPKQGHAPDVGSADIAFETGCDSVKGPKVIRTPSYGGGSPTNDPRQSPWMLHAAQCHPNWDACDDYAKTCHARNSAILLGDGLNDPVQFVICWTPEGAPIGGTGQALRVARAYQIPIYNLFWKEHKTALWKWIGKL